MKKLGEGISAIVYSDGEFAYKKYKETYDIKNIVYETQVQNEIYENTDLDVAHYEIVDNHIKMTLFTGKNLSDRILEEHYTEGFEDFIRLQLETFQYTNLNLADSYVTFQNQIEHTEEDQRLKQQALDSLQKITKTYHLCHFDYHPENVVYHEGIPRIIDWTNAKLGNPVMDIASTYIIFRLYAKDYAKLYIQTMLSHGFHRKDIEDAIPVMAFIRYRETTDLTLRSILEDCITNPIILLDEVNK